MSHPSSCRWAYGAPRLPVWVSTGVLEWPFWTKLIVVAIGFTGGLIFMYIQCKVYLQLWRRLKAFNRVITVQNCPEKGLHNTQAQTGNLTNGRHEAVEVPVAPAPAPEAQMDSDMSVEAAVAPAQNPVWSNPFPLPSPESLSCLLQHGPVWFRPVSCFSVGDYWFSHEHRFQVLLGKTQRLKAVMRWTCKKRRMEERRCEDQN